MPPGVVEVANRSHGESIRIEAAVEDHVAEASALLGFGTEHESGAVDPGHGLQIGVGRPPCDSVAGDSEGFGIDPDDRIAVFTRSPKRSVLVQREPGQPGYVGVERNDAARPPWLVFRAASAGDEQRYGNCRTDAHLQWTASRTAAAPRPPAAQIPSSAVSLPVLASSFAMVVTIRAPVAPNGCPIESEPP